jgi:hypothetical protein
LLSTVPFSPCTFAASESCQLPCIDKFALKRADGHSPVIYYRDPDALGGAGIDRRQQTLMPSDAAKGGHPASISARRNKAACRSAEQKFRRNNRQDLLTAANLDFGRFTRGSVRDAYKVGRIARRNDARDNERNDQIICDAK